MNATMNVRNTPNYFTDKQFEQKFMPESKMILGQFLLTDKFEQEDLKHNTDLIVLTMDKKRIACRGRRNAYLNRYPDDFTVRLSRPSGQKTEFVKIMRGMGDYIFYFIADEKEKHIAKWFVGDLGAFREYITREFYKNGKTFLARHTRANNDGTSSFLAINKNDIPNFIVEDSDIGWHHDNNFWLKIF